MQASGTGGGSAAAAPTGCFKCGRPGHWSRDCPLSSAAAASNPSSDPSPNPNPGTNFNPRPTFSASKFSRPQQPAGGEKPKKAPKTRPKLTPDLLLSDDGLGYVLRHFPRNFKYHGRGHEVSDLGNLIGLYAQWHSRLIPYYSFDQFIRKVEQVGATKRVRRCISELRERVARGGDPTKLHEPPVEEVAPDWDPEGTNMGDPVADVAEPPLENHKADEVQEEMFDEIFQKAMEEPCQTSESLATSEVNLEQGSLVNAPNQAGDSMSARENSKIQLTEEQEARMEANRLKALERVAARARSSHAP